MPHSRPSAIRWGRTLCLRHLPYPPAPHPLQVGVDQPSSKAPHQPWTPPTLLICTALFSRSLLTGEAARCPVHVRAPRPAPGLCPLQRCSLEPDARGKVWGNLEGSWPMEARGPGQGPEAGSCVLGDGTGGLEASADSSDVGLG